MIHTPDVYENNILQFLTFKYIIFIRNLQTETAMILRIQDTYVQFTGLEML